MSDKRVATSGAAGEILRGQQTDLGHGGSESCPGARHSIHRSSNIFCTVAQCGKVTGSAVCRNWEIAFHDFGIFVQVVLYPRNVGLLRFRKLVHTLEVEREPSVHFLHRGYAIACDDA